MIKVGHTKSHWESNCRKQTGPRSWLSKHELMCSGTLRPLRREDPRLVLKSCALSTSDHEAKENGEGWGWHNQEARDEARCASPSSESWIWSSLSAWQPSSSMLRSCATGWQSRSVCRELSHTLWSLMEEGRFWSCDTLMTGRGYSFAPWPSARMLPHVLTAPLQ